MEWRSSNLNVHLVVLIIGKIEAHSGIKKEPNHFISEKEEGYSQPDGDDLILCDLFDVHAPGIIDDLTCLSGANVAGSEPDPYFRVVLPILSVIFPSLRAGEMEGYPKLFPLDLCETTLLCEDTIQPGAGR
jgi:hypothetical protein